MVYLSRSNGLNAAHEEGARSDLSGGGLVIGHKHLFWPTYTFFGHDHMACYRLVTPVNQRVRYPFGYCRHVGCVLPLMVNPRWSKRAGERLDFYLQETLPNG